MGAVLNMRPELFHAALAGVPFVDCLTTMLDETIPLTASEWRLLWGWGCWEWGCWGCWGWGCRGWDQWGWEGGFMQVRGWLDVQCPQRPTPTPHQQPAVEWEEWGNPQQPEYYEYMKSYSPVDNVSAQRCVCMCMCVRMCVCMCVCMCLWFLMCRFKFSFS